MSKKKKMFPLNFAKIRIYYHKDLKFFNVYIFNNLTVILSHHPLFLRGTKGVMDIVDHISLFQEKRLNSKRKLLRTTNVN